MPNTDIKVNELIINKLTKEQYDSIDTPSETELYYITDDDLFKTKLSDLDDVNITSPTDGQSLVYDGTNSKWINYNISSEFNNYNSHNCMFRGKQHTLESLSAMIQAGDFSDIYVGDYFETVMDIYRFGIPLSVSNKTLLSSGLTIKWRVAGINNFLNNFYDAIIDNHVTLVPTHIGLTYMADTDDTTGAYANNKVQKEILPFLVNQMNENGFEGHLIGFRPLFSTQITSTTPSMCGCGIMGASTNCEWETSNIYLSLMSEVQVYGYPIWSSSAIDNMAYSKQLPLFKIANPNIDLGRDAFWLSCVASSTDYCHVGSYGAANHKPCTDSVLRIRPFCIFH